MKEITSRYYFVSKINFAPFEAFIVVEYIFSTVGAHIIQTQDASYKNAVFKTKANQVLRSIKVFVAPC